jgi:phospholipase/carboxylesterase
MPRTSFVLLLALVFGCKRDGAERTVSGLRVVEIFPHGADTSAPLVVALHGRGGRPEKLAWLWDDFPQPIQVALVQGPERFGWGWEWFDWPRGTSDDALAAAVGAAEDKLWPTIVALAHGRKVIVTGFSQGAMVAYALAARHPDEIAYAFPISGGAPHHLFPRNPARTAPVYALHGTDDDVIPVYFARATVAAFRDSGGKAELREFAATGHTITPAMHADLVTHIVSALAAIR